MPVDKPFFSYARSHSQDTVYGLYQATNETRERSGSVVECLTRDRSAASSNLTVVTVLCPWARRLNLCLVFV